MNAYLYTWNPKRWDWADRHDAVNRITNGEPYDVYWSCGNTKRIQIGDVFFLMMLGHNNKATKTEKGIVGCGYIASAPFPKPHWDKQKAEEGKTALRTDLLFSVLSSEPIISISYLNDKYPSYN